MYPLDAETILEIQRERQRWTVGPPRVNGWYWLRGWKEALLEPEMVLVDNGKFTPWGSDYDYSVVDTGGEWSGPLLPPS